MLRRSGHLNWRFCANLIPFLTVSGRSTVCTSIPLVRSSWAIQLRPLKCVAACSSPNRRIRRGVLARNFAAKTSFAVFGQPHSQSLSKRSDQQEFRLSLFDTVAVLILTLRFHEAAPSLSSPMKGIQNLSCLNQDVVCIGVATSSTMQHTIRSLSHIMRILQ